MIRKVIFLDIDGVISPTFDGEFMCQKDEYEKKRPKYDSKIYMEKAAAYAVEIDQRRIHPYDFYTIETRWDKSCIQKIKELLEKTDSVYVIESSWTNTYSTPEQMKDIMRLAGMEERYAGTAPGNRKDEGIRAYLADHKEVDRFIVIDDDDVWNFSEDYGMNFIRPHHLINDQDCMAAEDVLNRDYRICHDNKSIKIEDISETENAWIRAEYIEVEDSGTKFLVFDNVAAEYPDDQKRIILVRHLVSETRRLAAQEARSQNIVISLPEKLNRGVILHHLYVIWKDGLQLPGDRVIPEGNCAVIWARDSGFFIPREWAKQYFLSQEKEWDDFHWRFR